MRLAIVAVDSGYQIEPLRSWPRQIVVLSPRTLGDGDTMSFDQPTRLAIGGLLSMAAAFGIGRFVYTPILPAMLDALGWSKSEAGLVASSNFLGYLVGALIAAHGVISARPRTWLFVSLLVSAGSTIGMALPSTLPMFIGLRFAGGIASAFVIVCSSTLVLERLAAAGQGHLSSVHFAGVGVGIMASAALVAVLVAAGVAWQILWIGSGLIALLATLLVIGLIQGDAKVQALKTPTRHRPAATGLGKLIIAYGLFGFGYVITATFLVTIVRETGELRPLEPWIWELFGLAAVPSVAIWTRLGTRMGLIKAFALGCLVEAVGVATSVEAVSIIGIGLSTILIGGTFMGLTALGLMGARQLAGELSQRAIAQMTASFAVGQLIGPAVAGSLFDQLGNFRVASLLAAAALLAAAILANVTAASADRC